MKLSRDARVFCARALKQMLFSSFASPTKHPAPASVGRNQHSLSWKIARLSNPSRNQLPTG